MRFTMRSLAAGVAAAAGLAGLTGCQTYFGGMTLPSPHYLQHRPQYFPPDPSFPLQREVDSTQDPDGLLRRGAAGAAPAIGAAPPVGQAPVFQPGAPAGAGAGVPGVGGR